MAGAFELECYTDGSPVRVNGEELPHLHLVVDDLHDLIHAAQRMVGKVERP